MQNPVNSKSQPGSDRRPCQSNLFGYQDLDLVAALKSAINQALHESSLSREQVVDEINRLGERAGIINKKPISLALLDKWAAPSAIAYVPPVRFIPIICQATNSIHPIRAIASACGAHLINDVDRLILDWGRSELAAREARRRAKKLAAEVGA
jgi:hypothetical protein